MICLNLATYKTQGFIVLDASVFLVSTLDGYGYQGKVSEKEEGVNTVLIALKGHQLPGIKRELKDPGITMELLRNRSMV